MIGSGQELLEEKNDPSELDNMLQERRKDLEVETDEQKRSAINASIFRLGERIETLSTFEPRYPNLTFESSMRVYGSERSIELVTKGAGHTLSDCYIVMPDEKVIFMADLGFFAAQPFTAYADPQAWVVQLDEMESMDIDVFVPGHGPLGGKKDVAIQKAYISLVEQLVGEVVADGGSEEDALQIVLPEPYDSWKQTGEVRFEANVRATFARLSEA